MEKLDMKQTKQFTVSIAKEAGKIAMKHFGRPENCRMKDRQKEQVVCETDIAVESFLKSNVLEKFPDHSILAEESEPSMGNSEYLWIIDPIDGTRNYTHGHPTFGISIALAKNREVVLGVVYFPIYDWLFTAEKGKGAELNGKKIHVSARKPGDDTMGNYGCAFYKEKKEQIEILDRYIDIVRKVRIEGAATFGLCLVASGVYESYIARFTNPWDFAASCLAIEEAGGKVTDFKGNKWSIDIKEFVASNNMFHDKLLEAVRGQ